MPAKKKSKRKSPKSKTRTSKKRTSLRKSASKAKSSKKSLKKAALPKKTAELRRTRPASVSAARELEQEIRNRRVSRANSSETQSDFQGLSRAADANSESVDELVEEGNTFEAGAVAGVEEVEDSDEREVHTREVPEDDVPDEYLEKD